MIAAVVGIVERDGRVLALRRAAHKPGAGLWEVVSGRLEPGEEPLDAVAREIREETGFEVLVDPRPVDAYQATRANEPMLVVVYRARWRAGALDRSLEHDAERWCTPTEFRALTTLTRLADAVDRALAGAA